MPASANVAMTSRKERNNNSLEVTFLRYVQPAQLNPERIAKQDVLNLLLKVSVRPDKSFTASYPEPDDSEAQERSVVQSRGV